ncbi:hypothetical protein HanXRQr2_Chr15g0680631 [Helianthus annuus]|uniref:Uncharacterized protein n=1 Tax=Helianthus annuus TaxID=4232 RepID=A0A9K3DY93_HELAN|nr:hypothetical protein HanXRQr2_Chr15g0680631 [Helianthus annuus]KAJ0830218.1 hypothetical protein HanPSC8_Chr15g0652701 [Helianthus annuus]
MNVYVCVCIHTVSDMLMHWRQSKCLSIAFMDLIWWCFLHVLYVEV